MISDKSKEKFKNNLSPEATEKALNLYDEISKAINIHNKLETMSNKELAQVLLLDVWAELPIWSTFSSLIEEVIDRLMEEKE